MASRDGSLPPDVGTPDGTFTVVFGTYAGWIFTGFAALVGTTLGLSPGSTFLTLIAVFAVVGTVAGVAAGRVAGLAERLGHRRRYWVACALPSAVFAVVAVSSYQWSMLGSGVAFVGPLFAMSTAFTAFLVVAMAHTRYVDLVVDDESTASWRWRNTNPVRLATVVPVSAILFGSLQLSVDSPSSYSTIALGVGALVVQSKRVEKRLSGTVWDPNRAKPTLYVHDGGLLARHQWRRTLVPWTSITNVRLTDDELVLERERWFDIRCDRTLIDDDSELVRAIERARVRAGMGRV